MNRIYRSIWNQATGAYAAVSENVKSAGKRSMPGSSGGGAHFALTGMAAALMLGYGSLALAGPAGGTVVAGQATINGAPGNTVIQQGSQHAVINWASFNIGKGESVQFQQPNSNAVALNRVLGSDGTTILGKLSANGKVFIVNPNGVLFGHGASVNTAGLVASTLDISNADFMAGKYQFSGNGSGKVLNQGNISAPGGYVALLGANVSNEGTIQARLGSVALAAGRAITLDVAGDGLLNVAVDRGAVGALVNNGGLIQADGGSVVLTAQAAGDLLKTVVNNTGVIEAHSIDTRGGTIKLLGDMQSGTVNAAGTLDASAPAGGNGGFIDTSAAHVKIDDALKVTTAAAKGLSGTWLIDPTDFNIAVSGGDMTGAFLSNSLKSGNVQIQSVSGGSGTQGNINVNDNINWTANKLTLTAQNNININKAMRGAGTASLALEYGQSALAAGNLSTYNVKAEVDLPSGNNFSTKLGSNGSVTVYQVINSLGAFNSTSGNDVQGMQGNLSGNYVLGSNIDASATGSWDSGKGFVPIGSAGTPFTGKFDGLGHELYGLTINRPETPVGMFGNIGAAGSVRNLSLSNVNITGSQAVFSAAYTDIGALAGRNNGTIENVSSSGAVHGSGYINMGALVGTNAGTLSNSRAAGTVVAGAYGAAGGLVGVNAAGGLIKGSSSAVATTSANYFAGGLAVFNRGTISDSYATGAISVGSAGGSYGGGLAAINDATGVVTNSYATGNVTGVSGLGGLLGRIESGGTVDNSYATGNVTGTGNNIGGLVGLSYGPIRNSYATGNVTANSTVGGVVGYNLSTMTNVYYSGKLTAGGASVGMIVGDNNGGTVTNAYFDKSLNGAIAAIGVTGNAATSNALGLTSAQMLQGSNFAGFNFTNTAGAAGNNWVIVSGDGSINGASAGTRPMLASEWSNTINSTHQLQLMAMNKAASYTLGSSFSAASTAANGNDVWGSTGFIPVGTAGSAFTGSLDGTGHIVSNLNIIKSGVAGVGLFGVVGSGGVIANVGLSGGAISGGDNTGALVGMNGGSVSGSFATSAVTGANNVGGLVGTSTGTLKDSYASGAVTGSSGAGGLVGSNSGTVATSYANGSVSGAGGGLVGAGAGSVTGSYWDTTASGKATSAGGTDLTTSGLKTLSNYTGAGWELAQMWVVYDGQSAPFLRSFMKQITVRVSYDSKVYDGVAYAGGSNSLTYSNTVAGASLLGTPIYAGNAAGAVNAGTYGVSASGLYSSGGQSGYAISYIDGGLVITPKSVTLNGAAVTGKVYDGTTTASISGTLSGVLAGDLANVSSAVNGTYASKNAGNGIAVTIDAALGGSAGGNYALAPVVGLTGDISKATISAVTGIVAGNKTYDGSANASLNTTGATFAGMVGGDSLSVSGASGSFGDKNAGTGKTVSISGIVLGGTDAGNYNLTGTTASSTADISKATIASVGGIVAGNKTYDGSAAASLNTAGVTFAGMVGGDSLTVSGASGSFVDKNAANGKTVNISGMTLGGTDADNYTLTSSTASTTANISKATINGVTGIVAENKVYDGNATASLNAAGAAFAGMVAGDSLTVSGASGSFADKNAASGKTVSISGIALGGTDAGNYNLASSTASGTADIGKATISGVAGIVAGNKVYDGSAAASLNTAGASFTGMVGGDSLTVSGASGSFVDKNAANGKTVNISGITLGGTDAGNYNLTSSTASSSANISKATINGVTGIVAENKVYDGNATASLNTAGAAFAGMVAGDSLSVSGASGSFADKNAGNGKTVSISGIALGGTDAGNYNLTGSTASSSADIAKATIASVSGLAAGNKVYDGSMAASLNTAGAAFSGMVAGDNLTVSNAVGTFSDKNAGNGKVVNVSGIVLGGTDAGNYNLASDTAASSANISAKALTLTGLSGGNKVYDGTANASLAGGALNGLVNAETLAFIVQGASYSDKNAGTGKTITVGGVTLSDGTGLAGNYTLSAPASLTGDIAKATISGISGLTALDKVYNGNLNVSLSPSSAVINGKIAGDDVQLFSANGAFTDKNVGSNKAVNISNIALSGSDVGNYIFTNNSATATASITPKAVTLSGVTAGNKVYDGTTAAILLGGTLSGMVAGETLGFSGGVGTFSDKNAGTGKLVTISGTVLQDGTGLASNYTFSSPGNVNADISKASISGVTNVGVNNKTYDGLADATLTGAATFNGKIGNDSLTLAGNGAFSDKNAGTGKTVNVSGITLAGADAGNYNLVSTVASSTADIAKADISSVTNVGVNNKIYDGLTTATLNGAAIFNGKISGDVLTLAGSGAFGDKNAGTGKTVTVSGITLGGADAGNYNLVSNASSGTADIGKATIGSVTDVGVNSKTYDGLSTATLNGAATFNGKIGGDTLALAGTSAFSDKNAGTGKTVTISGITLAGADAGNYILVSNTASGTADITPKVLTVVGQLAADKVYDGNAVAQLSGGSLAGLVAGETLAIAGQTAAFGDKNAGNAKAVTVSGTTLLDGSGLASNYTVSNPTGLTANITPASISAISGIVAANKVYDGGTAASLNLAGASFNGMVAGDALSLAGGPVLGTFGDKNATTGKTVTISGLGLGGADAGNYVLASNLASTTADITPATLTVSASGVNKVYDATTNALVSLRDNRIGNDQLSIASNGASFGDKNAGVGKTVTVAGIRLSGADAGNYVVNGTASTTATITQAALTVKVDNAEKDQGRANPDFSAGYSGLLGGDTLAAEVSGKLAFGTPATMASAAGSYLVSASGQASTNYALNYVDGVLTVKPTEALQSAVASVIAAVAVAPSQGNMVQADMIASGEAAPGKSAATQDAPREAEQGAAGSAPVVQLAGNVVNNVLPGLRLSVVDSGLRLPVEAGGNTRQDSQ
ncbi:YDG domain-containing protein [Janthinobacterium sp. SUN137]|uniref:YDG domain-containing protein n=1 Tax=Janthinobacterium sp. SUN137 TaxID=3014789 RepID=UPI002713EFB4|nr:YDG domain-containing protein [Janthinobacterium sp. SUN137]MDO8041045.1 YDG domain-containing protein [Janthinobacterium sp. SUN137]